MFMVSVNKMISHFNISKENHENVLIYSDRRGSNPTLNRNESVALNATTIQVVWSKPDASSFDIERYEIR